eukprot:1938524-Prymnesium_polylepis.1
MSSKPSPPNAFRCRRIEPTEVLCDDVANVPRVAATLRYQRVHFRVEEFARAVTVAAAAAAVVVHSKRVAPARLAKRLRSM